LRRMPRVVSMLAKVLSSAVLGIDAYEVEVEVDITMGLPAFATVGLPNGAVRESKDRVKSAIKNSGFRFPPHRITVNLAPADMKKEGAGFDLPIAIGILAAQGEISEEKLEDTLILGELALRTIWCMYGSNPEGCGWRKRKRVNQACYYNS